LDTAHIVYLSAFVAPYKFFTEIPQTNIGTVSRNQILLSKLTGASALLARQPHKIARIIAKLERSAHCAISPEERRVRCRKLEMQGGGSVVANHAPEHANTMIMIRAAIHSLLLWMGLHQA
jgi:hypothetical protein